MMTDRTTDYAPRPHWWSCRDRRGRARPRCCGGFSSAAACRWSASVSATTRPPRPGETDGVDYHFLTPEEFDRRRRNGEFIECYQVFEEDDWYGTLRSEVDAGLRAGKWVVLNIDVHGAMAVMEQFPDAITIFVRPGSVEELERRLAAAAPKTRKPSAADCKRPKKN